MRRPPLRAANGKFERRFRAMERLAEADGFKFEDLSLDEQEAYWNQIKQQEQDD